MTFAAAPDRYDRMTYNRIGRSGLKLPASRSASGTTSATIVRSTRSAPSCRRAFDLGITHFDLANNYGPPPGSAEENFGRLLATDFAPYRDELIVSSKAGYLMWAGPYGEWGSRKYLLASLDQSLERLGLDYVDIFYSHRPDPETPVEETMGALAQRRASGQGAVRRRLELLPRADARAAASGSTRRASRCSSTSRGTRCSTGTSRTGLFPVLDEVGAAAIVFSPLAQGLLTDRYLSGEVPAGRGPRRAASSAGPISEEYLERPGR